jgi:hypothetical protein
MLDIELTRDMFVSIVTRDIEGNKNTMHAFGLLCPAHEVVKLYRDVDDLLQRLGGKVPAMDDLLGLLEPGFAAEVKKML